MYELLKGTRILDLTSVVLGPFATQIFGDLGAEVVKIERLTGDTMRNTAPMRGEQMGANFVNLNRNKQSLAIDLKHPDGLRVIHKLVAGADVLIHNMRQAAMDRLNLGYDDLKPLNPRLIYCAAVGFSRYGRYRDEPAYDDIIQARAGFAALNGMHGPAPNFVPTVLSDKVGGLYAVYAVLAALLHRERTGEGLEIETPMFENMVSFLLAEHLAGQVFEPPLSGPGYRRLTTPYRRPHPTADGHIALTPYHSEHWRRILELVGREDLMDADWLMEPTLRSHNFEKIYELMDTLFVDRPTAEWIEILRGIDIPCSAAQTLDELLEDPHLRDAGFFRPTKHPSEGDIVTMKHPVAFPGLTDGPDKPTPKLGQDSDHVLRNLGYDDGEIERLESAGVVGRFEVPT